MPDTLHAYDHVQSIYFPIAIAVFAIVVASLLVLLVTGARRKRPEGRSHAPRFEVAYALMLTCLVVVLLWVSFRAEAPIDRTAAHPALRIGVSAAQWSWRFEYPNGRSVTAVS